jgi:hypothetical protein
MSNGQAEVERERLPGLAQYFSRMNDMRVLYTLAPSGRKKQLPGDRLWKKKSSW